VAEIEELLKCRKVSSNHKKTRFSVKENLQALICTLGLKQMVFFTVTLKNRNGKVPTHDRLKFCWRKFEKILVKKYPLGGWAVTERGGETQRLHMHGALGVAVDVWQGYDFEAARAVQKANPRAKWSLHPSANAALRQVHDDILRMAKRAGFGTIFHCEPIRSAGEAVAKYFSKYVTKNIEQRLFIDKGRRMFSCFGEAMNLRAMPSAARFAYGGPLWEIVKGERRPHYQNGWAWLYRKKAAKYWAKLGIRDADHARETYGPKWAYRHHDCIMETKLDVYPHFFLAILDGRVDRDDMEEMGAWDELAGPLTIKTTDLAPLPSPVVGRTMRHGVEIPRVPIPLAKVSLTEFQQPRFKQEEKTPTNWDDVIRRRRLREALAIL